MQFKFLYHLYILKQIGIIRTILIKKHFEKACRGFRNFTKCLKTREIETSTIMLDNKKKIKITNTIVKRS